MTSDVVPVIDDAELETCLKVFRIIEKNPSIKEQARENLKIRELFALINLVLFPPYAIRNNFRKKGRQEKRQQDKELLDSTLIRQSRPILRVAPASGSETSFERLLKPLKSLSVHDIEALDGDRNNSIQETMNHHPPRLLHFDRCCHICRQSFKIVHYFYDQLCPSCAELNFSKRNLTVDLEGKVCLVTGARIKIGFMIAVKLLEMGATVIVTTRFPHDAAKRYANELGFSKWSTKLFIHGIDLRDMALVHAFTKHIKSTFHRLDLLMNNAAQTVRKPPAFYEHLMAGESVPLPNGICLVTNVVNVYKSQDSGYRFVRLDDSKTFVSNESKSYIVMDSPEKALPAQNAITPLSKVNHSAKLSQLSLIDGDEVESGTVLFPKGALDRDEQQIDLRSQNSWTLELGQIATTEMVECHVINAFAPWVLISELKPLMQATPGRKYVVNVSAMEGQFYRTKTIYHPHTNMAKASLNMLTRTSAAGFAEIDIFMTAVDTGWITDENPIELHEQRANNPPPLDEIDAAMRCLDPFLVGLSPGGKQYWGVFLKNYFPTRW